jgi:hypothetical protein
MMKPVHYQYHNNQKKKLRRPALDPTQPLIQLVPEALSLAVRRPGREADHSPPSSVKVKESVKIYLHSPNTSSWRGA